MLALPLGDYRAWAQGKKAAGPAHLRIPLDQWGGITVEHKGKQVILTPAEIFAALKEKE